MVGLYGNAGTIVYPGKVANFKKKITFSLKTCIIEKKVVSLQKIFEGTPKKLGSCADIRKKEC